MSKRFALMILAVLAVACSSAVPAGPTATATPPPVTITAETVEASLKASGLPITDLVIYTVETDPNKLLGRPNQYTGKVSWFDARAPGGDNDATVELFPDQNSLNLRLQYTGTISASFAFLAKYIYQNDDALALMRLPHTLTPDQAKEYETWLATLGR